MKVIGVTGGTGSGKSTVSQMLGRLGAVVVDADKIVREVVAKGGKALQEIREYFSDGVMLPNGELDRSKLSEIVFGDKEKLQILNAITHKYIVERITSMVEQCRSDGKTSVVVVDVPLPVRHGFLDLVDQVWVVTAPRETRIARLMERSGITDSEACKRIDSQMSDEQYRSLADVLIQNDSGREELAARVRELYDEIVRAV